jgi:hypothetical protein
MNILQLTINRRLVILTLAALMISCSKTSPAGFWIDFHKDLILTKDSDQGPWGGHREIYWKSESNKTFTARELIDYANSNDWKLVDSISFSADTLTNKSFSRLKNDDYSLDILNESILSKLKSNDCKLFIYKTTWLAVEPGNTRDTFENGYAVLSSDGAGLKIYHTWGE